MYSGVSRISIVVVSRKWYESELVADRAGIG